MAQSIAEALRENSLEVDLLRLHEVKSLAGYRAIVMGAPLFMFRWHKDAINFLQHGRQAVSQTPVAVFALGPVHEPHDEAEWMASGDQLEKELAHFPWFKTVALKVFGGKYDPAVIGFPLKLFAGNVPASDIRDWTAINAWAEELIPMLAA